MQAGFTLRKVKSLTPALLKCQSNETTKQKTIRKAGIIPDRFTDNDAVKSQKDCDVRWAKKIIKVIMAIKTISASITNIS